MGILGFVSNFKHKSEIRESRDEILIGELIFLVTRMGWPLVGLRADGDFQSLRFRCPNDDVLHALEVRLDRKTGGSVGQTVLEAAIGTRATLFFKAEVKNKLADPDDLVNMFSTDVKNILKIPLVGQVKVNHELNSVYAERGQIIDIGKYILKGQQGRDALQQLIDGTVQELKGAVGQYKRG